MRIIAGKLGGRSLKTKVITGLRPTASRTREGVMSALASRLDWSQAVVLDLFSGSGSYAFEALSRGARFALCVESNPECAELIQENARYLKVEASLGLILWTVESNTADKLWRHLRVKLASQGLDCFNLIFVDPPYTDFLKYISIWDALASTDIVSADTWWVLEAPSGKNQDTHFKSGCLVLDKTYVYGDSTVMLCQTKQSMLSQSRSSCE